MIFNSSCIERFTFQTPLISLLSKDEFIQRNLLPEREHQDYVIPVHGKHFRSEKFLKLIISKKRCKEFVTCMQELPEHEHIYKINSRIS